MIAIRIHPPHLHLRHRLLRPGEGGRHYGGTASIASRVDVADAADVEVS